MKIVNSKQMKNLDRIAVDEFGIPEAVLMENAGIAVFHEVMKSLERMESQRVSIICGRGNNGGDGFVAARHLFQQGVRVKVFIIGNPTVIAGAARVNYEIIENLGLSIETIGKTEEIHKLIDGMKESGLIVDAIFGTGLDREMTDFMRDIIHRINELQKKVISVDIASGVMTNTGAIAGAAIKAEKTVVLQLPKIGNVNYPGAAYCGELVLKDIGIPHRAIGEAGISINLITKDVVKDILPMRKKDTHKGNYGKAYIVAGSTGMTGAAMLTAEAILRSGAGLLKVAIPQSLNNIMEVRLTEAITVPLPELKRGCVGISDIDKIIKIMEQSDVIAVGPGSGQSRELEEVLRNVFENSSIPMVLDADALNAIAHRLELFNLLKSPAVLTPHVGEMSRMTGISVEEINANRIQIAQDFSKKWNAIIVLKGVRTVVASPEGEVYINTTGNPGMATAGSGDVLTGIITGFIAQGIDPFLAAAAAVYVHGDAGDRAAERLGEYGLIAGDLVLELPQAIKNIVGR
ncbi:MAG: NAD(P)H-hydrate dehydratase [Bacillota bacterium]